MVEEPVDGGGVQDRAVRETRVRGRVLVRRATGVEEHLQRQRQAGGARQDGVDGGQRAPGTVAAHRQARPVQAQLARVPGQPGQCVPGVVRCGRKAVLRRQPVVERQHGAAGQTRQLAAQRVVRGAAADGEAPAVQVQQHRQAGRGVGRHQAGAEQCAIARRNGELLGPRQLGARHLQDAGAQLVRGARLLRRECVQGRAPGARHALEHAAHLRRQARGVDVGVARGHSKARDTGCAPGRPW